MFALPVLAIIVLVYVVTTTVLPADSAPQSATYLEYRKTMRRRLKIAFIVPIAAMAALFIYNSVALAIDSENPSAIPAFLRYPLGALWFPGFFLLPLIAMLFTERTTRPSGPRVATLAHRRLRDLIPRWLAWPIGGAVTGAALAPLILAHPIGSDRLLQSANNPPHSMHEPDLENLLFDYASFLVAAVLAIAVAVAATRRPDIDPQSGSDSWSRSGTAVRALCLLYIPAVLVIVDALELVRGSSLDYIDHLRAGGDPISGWGWLDSGSVPYIADGLGLLLYLGVIVALVTFAKPPVPRSLARVKQSVPANEQ